MKKLLFLTFCFISIQLSAQNWTMVLDSCYANKIFCFGSDTVYVAGGGPRLYVSTDAGNNWINVLTPYFDKVFFLSSKVGFGINNLNNTLYKTFNGGINWDSIYYFIEDVDHSTIHFINQDIGFFSTYYHLLKTVDGGMHWNICFDMNADAFENINDSTYIISSGYIYKSTDWGNTWVSKNFMPYAYHFFKVNDTIIYGGDLCRSTDAAETWEWRNTYSCASWRLGGIYFFNKDSGIVCGHDMPGGCLHYTTDGGLNVYPLMVDGNSEYFYDVYFLPNSCTGYLMGFNKLYKNTECWGPTKVPAIKADGKNVVYYNKEENSIEIKNKNSDYSLFELFNILGKPVFTSNITNPVLKLPILPKGIYFGRTTTNKNQTTANKILIY